MAPQRYFAILGVALAALAVSGRITRAQQSGCELRLETSTLEVGEVVTAQITCTNTGRPEAPQITSPNGLQLTLVSDTPSSSSFTQIINGQVTQRSTYTFPAQLTGAREGTYSIGPITVVTDAGTHRTAPVQVVVRKSQAAGTVQGDRYIFAELEVEPRSVYVTQRVVATLTFGIRKVELGGKVFDLDMLRDVLDAGGSQLSVFANGRAQRSERWLPDGSGVRHQYEVFRVPKEIRAEQVGELSIGPVFLKAEYPTAQRRSFFGGFEVTSRRRETARAEAITVQVQTPPVAGRPADYTGAIGQFAMTVSARPEQVEQNQPITLSISISGSPLEGVAAPDLTRHPELASRFQFSGDELVGDIVGDAKVFRRAIFPRQAGVQTVPAITWSYFDPTEERYVTLSAEPTQITVTPLTNSGRGAITGLDDSPPTAATNLTLVSGGLSPNYVDADAVLANQSVSGPASWLALLVLPPVAWAGSTLVVLRRARIKADPSYLRRRRARRVALAGIDRAVRMRSPAEQWIAIGEALTRFVADHFGLAGGALTPDEVRSVLESHGLNGSVAVDVRRFLEQCDAARFARIHAEQSQAAASIRQVREWIAQIERTG